MFFARILHLLEYRAPVILKKLEKKFQIPNLKININVKWDFDALWVTKWLKNY